MNYYIVMLLLYFLITVLVHVYRLSERFCTQDSKGKPYIYVELMDGKIKIVKLSFFIWQCCQKLTMNKERFLVEIL
jgi:hypothetical protein